VMLLPLPIRRNLRLVMLFVRCTWKSWSFLAQRLGPGDRRERLLGVYGPLSLVLLICLWVGGLILGFGLIHLALRPDSFLQALYFSGITFFTVGYGDLVPRSIAMKAVAVVEAGSGLGFLALVIGYLPVLYQLFARREAHVMLLDERAGSPPTATELFKRHADGRSLDALDQLLREWEVWASELLESHMSYPMLGFYRSQYSNQSWTRRNGVNNRRLFANNGGNRRNTDLSSADDLFSGAPRDYRAVARPES
jgi:Ion channel